MFGALTEQNIATLMADGSAIILLVGILMETGIMQRRGRVDDKLFFRIVKLIIIMAVFDMVRYLIDKKQFAMAGGISITVNTLFYVTLILTVMAWFHYALVRFKRIDSKTERKYLPYFIPGVLVLVFIFINIFTGWIFSVDENNVYHHEKLFVPMFVVIVYFIVASLVPIFKYRVGSDKKALIPMWVFILPILAPFLVPFVFGGVSLTAVSLAMIAMFAHLGSASEMVNYDANGGKKL
jgi:hypothetical protein